MKTVKINGKTWMLNLDRDMSADLFGECVNVSSDFGGSLDINADQAGANLIDTIVHEWLHALLPNAKEEWVEEEASGLTQILTDTEVITRIGLYNHIHVTKESL